MRLSKLNILALALIFSVVAEVVLFVAGYVFGSCGSSGPNASGIMGFVTYICVAFHSCANRLSFAPAGGGLVARCVGILIFFGVALFQWWLIFVVSIAVSRYFRKRA